MVMPFRAYVYIVYAIKIPYRVTCYVLFVLVYITYMRSLLNKNVTMCAVCLLCYALFLLFVEHNYVPQYRKGILSTDMVCDMYMKGLTVNTGTNKLAYLYTVVLHQGVSTT